MYRTAAILQLYNLLAVVHVFAFRYERMLKLHLGQQIEQISCLQSRLELFGLGEMVLQEKIALLQSWRSHTTHAVVFVSGLPFDK